MIRRTLFSPLLVLALAACGSAETPRDAAPPDAARAAGDAPDRLGGVVAESFDAGGYTYVRVDVPDGEDVWVAGPVTPLAPGDPVTFAAGLPMEQFHSPALGRTFERIYFTAAFEGIDPDRDTPGHDGRPEVAAADLGPGSIALPEGGVRVAELWTRRGELVGQRVTVRGEVTKANTGILDRNWLHLQDGSGDAASGTHDLTVTTSASAEPGEVVTVTGTVAVDRDFGAGYAYELILEDAELQED